MQRGPRAPVTRIDRRAGFNELLNFGDVAFCRRCMQTAISLQLGRAWRRLRRSW
jgi:hypothetical protein